MDRNVPSASGAFNSLPIELNKAIAHEVHADKDIATYGLICRATNDAIDADNKSFWRIKFREKYALKEGESNTRLRRVYQRRAKSLRRGIAHDFFHGHRRREVNVLEILREIIVESFQGTFKVDEYGRPRCKNQDQLLGFVLNSKIAIAERRAPALSNEHINPLLAAVKLMCSHFLFDREGATQNVFAVDELQRAVYQPTNKSPLYRGLNFTEVNLEWILNCSDFFRHHMMNASAASLFENVNELPMTQKPSAWREPFRQGAYALSKHWRGTYSFLDHAETQKLRNLDPNEANTLLYVDKNVEEGKIQSLELDFIEDGQHLRWPAIFEDRLHSLRDTSTSEPRAKAQGRAKPKNFMPSPDTPSIQFMGKGQDLDDDFNAIGWLNPLPPQAGIPGWQRITFMKHFETDLDVVEQDNLWAYEGVVLPGGRIILGRWWYASDHVNFDSDYNGPFILWAVDPDPELKLDDECKEE